MGYSEIMWQMQSAIHGKSNAALPAFLIGAASILLVYCHAMDGEGGDPTKTFLTLIIVQMLPLVFLEMKILSCPDPVSMMSRFGTKVLLMHIAFLILRVLAWPILEINLGLCNIVGLVLAVVSLQLGFGFRWSLSAAREHLDVLGLASLAVVAALATELLDFHRKASLLEMMIFTSSSYIEILAFVPAVWMVHQTAKKCDDCVRASEAVVQRQAAFFFFFLLLFYVSEDVISAVRVGAESPLAALGHMVHFVLLLDFACFLLAYIYNPGKLQGNLMSWLPDALWV